MEIISIFDIFGNNTLTGSFGIPELQTLNQGALVIKSLNSSGIFQDENCCWGGVKAELPKPSCIG